MKNKVKLMSSLVLIVAILTRLINAKTLDASTQLRPNSMSLVQKASIPSEQIKGANKTTTKSSGELETAPSITSVHHQVWTSSSSGSLDELSPEIISKLRQDVPFLAAYALRPRLVGGLQAPPTMLPSTASIQAPQIEELPGSKATSASLDSAASSPKAARQTLASESVPKALGDFSEFKVETSSTSKSEHHHKRKTSLKRQTKEQAPTSSTSTSLKRSTSSDSREAGSLAKRQDLTKRTNKKSRSNKGNARSGVRKNKREKSGSSGSSKLLKGSFKSSSRRDRFVQTDEGKTTNANELDVLEEPRIEEATKGGDTKSASKTRGNKRPFYAGAQPKAGPDATTRPLKPGSRGDGDEGREANGVGASPPTKGEPNEESPLDNEQADGGELDDEPRGEPKRVGDDEVDEDGDTVLVEPKSDGIDDDPELPSEEEVDEKGGEADREREEPTEAPNGLDQRPAGADTRGKRVNRERPNLAPANGDDNEGAEENGGSTGQAAGGGVGATIGGGGRTSTGGPVARGGVAKESPGVEFAGGDHGDDQAINGGADGEDGRGGVDSSAGRSGSSSPGQSAGSGPSGATGGDGGGAFGNRNEAAAPAGSTGESGASRGGQPGDEDGTTSGPDDDLDYRDEMEAGGRGEDGSAGARRPAGSGAGTLPRASSPRNGGSQGQPSVAGAGAAADEAKTHLSTPVNDGSQGTAKGNDCPDGSGQHDDGAYKPHDEKYHAQHHQTIDWLRGSIPGEPDDDYPILDRVTNGTNFKCSDHEHAGYYADVEARCQIFHICQADGRQDSFLCPNGTIFSQKTLVCVWWNGFHCEDAPKFYHLNELLYKSTSAGDSPQAAALPGTFGADGTDNDLGPPGSMAASPMQAPIKPRGMKLDVDDDGNDSSIESLLRAMRRRNSMSSSNEMSAFDSAGRKRTSDDRASMRADDESTIQRKSTLDGDGDADLAEATGPSSRLRSRDNTPRRKRRASARQAPPKLKSRRVSRNSRRRKLRHGIKPKRRA